jgi:hypothetical protein
MEIGIFFGTLIVLVGAYFVLRRRAKAIAANPPKSSVNPFDGSTEQARGPRSIHDPSPAGIFDRNGRRELAKVMMPADRVYIIDNGHSSKR